MAQQVFAQKFTVKRIDEVVREQEERDFEESLSKARRASNKGKRAVELAQNLIDEINQYV